jgi:uncharacterized protein YdaU (DUF1376 family)
MAKSPAFQFYPADYLADENVALMSLEEEGAYIRAMCHCWREGSIPADPEKLSRLLKNCSNQTRTTVQVCFVEMTNDPSRLVHPRLEIERKKQDDWTEKSRSAGIKSGKARRIKKLHTEPPFTNGCDLVRTKHEPNTNSSSSSSSSNKEPPTPLSDEPLDASMAVSGLILKTGIHTPKARIVLDSMAHQVENAGEDLYSWVETMVAAWKHLEASRPKLEYAWGAETFFGEGHYKTPDGWPWKNGYRPGKKIKAVNE